MKPKRLRNRLAAASILATAALVALPASTQAGTPADAVLLAQAPPPLVRQPEERPRKVYRWVDESGETHFGYYRPRGAEAETVDIKLPTTSPTDAGPEPDATPEETGPEGGAPPERELSEEEQALYAANCRIARENLKALDADPDRIWEQDEEGNLVPVGVEEVEARRAEARKNIETYCR
jgi:hypothetical protein